MSKIEKGSKIYKCVRFADDNRFNLCEAVVEDIEQTFTPKGRARNPVYIIKPLNYVSCKEGKECDVVRDEAPERIFSTSPVIAVSRALKKAFTRSPNTTEPKTAEERLLAAIFGEDELDADIRIDFENIPAVIQDLKDLHKLYAKALAIENEIVEAM